MKSNRDNFPILWSIKPFVLPKYKISDIKDTKINLYSAINIFDTSVNHVKKIPYDINRVSSRNARKSELGPYKNSDLRNIILSHDMGKASGTKSDLVSTILNFHENKSV